jgi:hypothetical protein
MPLILIVWSAFFASDPDRPEVIVADPSGGTPIPVATASSPAGDRGEAPAASTATPTVKREHERQLQKLQVQKALYEAKRSLDADDAAAAIKFLEEQLSSAGGAEDYLELLDAAYRRQLAALVKADKKDEANLLEERRKIITSRTPMKSAAQTIQEPEIKTAVAEAKPQPKSAASGGGLFGQLFGKKTPAKNPDKDDMVVRARWDHRNPESNEPAKPEAEKASPASDDLRSAEKFWKDRDFAKALQHYEAAYRADPQGAVQDARDRFGYCLLWSAYSKYEPKTADADASIDDRCFEEWESDVKQGRQLVRLESFRKFADDQLKLVEERRQARYRAAAPSANAPVAPSPKPAVKPSSATSVVANVSYRHLDKQHPGGWRVTETENFRIYHRDVALAEEVAVIAETSRSQAHEMWFTAEPLAKWSPKCDLVLYPTAQEFAQQTNQMPQSPAFTQCDVQDGWVASRRIELRVDEPNMKNGILPHEIAHAVFAGQFARRSPPKWADEGMAVLTEPEDIQNRHLAGLVSARSQQRGFRCDQLLPMQTYPSQVQEFYAHSVGVCRMLVERHGGRERLVQFVRTATETNDYDGALFRVYAIRGMKDLETRFQEYVGELRTNGYASR